MLRRLTLSVCFALFLPAWSFPAGNASKVNRVLVKLQQPKQGATLESFVLSEADINAFTEVAIQSKKRLGVKKVEFEFRPGGVFYTRALINMDEVELTGFAVRMFKSVLSGVQTLEAEGKLTSLAGKGTYQVQRARFNNIPVPAWLVNSVIGFLGKRQPPHIDVTEPFEWPYGVRDVKVVQDQVVIIR